jgi:hypothetical protein
MRRVTLPPWTALLASAALLALPAAPAGAGQCANEIENMSKLMAAHDAGTGPTPGAPGTASTTQGQHPPTAAMSHADSSTAASRAAENSATPQHPPTAAMNRETTGKSSAMSRETDGNAMPTYEAAPSKDEHPPTAAMNQATTGAASPQDVQRQNEGQPTAAQQAAGKQQIDSSHTLARAMTSLEQARTFDRQGNESECLRALGEAKLMLGTR